MSTTAPKRRNVFIKKAFQGRFIGGVFLLMLLSGLCSALLIYWMTGGDLQAQSESAHINIANAWARLGLSLLIGNVVAILIAGTLSVFVVMYASHKIAGPLYRFEKLCEQVGNGELEIITAIREKDQLQDLANAFLEMVNKIRARKQRQQDCISSILNQIEQLKNNNSPAPNQVQALEQLEQTVKQLSE
jgi:methyl-accepting chemotaxis protein